MIGIMADSHDNLNQVKLAVRFFNDRKCDLVIHAGDFVAPFTALELKKLDCPVKAVFGNCDGERAGLARALEGCGEIHDEPFTFRHGGLTFQLFHSNKAAERCLLKPNFDILIFGHTHKPETRLQNGIRVINPGETGAWVSGKSTIALFDPNGLTVEIVTIN